MLTKITAWLMCVLMLVPGEAGFARRLHLRTAGRELAAFLIEDTDPVVQTELTCGDSAVVRTQLISDTAQVRLWQFPSGAFVCQRRETAQASFCFDLPGKCSLRWAQDGSWNVSDSVTGCVQSLYIDVTDEAGTCSLILYPPKAYRSAPYGCIEEALPFKGGVTVEPHGDFTRISVSIPAPEAGAWADWTLLYAESELIDWDDPVMQSIWIRYSLTGESRMTLDGTCYHIEDDYEPKGEYIFEYAPSMYVPGGMARTGGSDAAFYLSTVMLDMARARYSPLGFFPTETLSLWLQRDYGFGPGFYDTRFNTDLAEAYRAAGQRWGIPEFTAVADAYTAYLLAHVREHGVPTRSGVLSPDYTDYTGKGSLTHTSLNHQLSEILYLYRCGSAAAVETADRMLAGICDLGTRWLREDGSLYYARLPNGTFGLQDYPYLTYNDLYDVQAWLAANGRGRNAVLDQLMASKRASMDREGITGYKK